MAPRKNPFSSILLRRRNLRTRTQVKFEVYGEEMTRRKSNPVETPAESISLQIGWENM